MLAPILIDLSGVVEQLILTEDQTAALSHYVLSNIADEYMRYWEKNIDQNLHKTRSEYRKAIFTEQPDDTSVVFGMTPRQSKLGMMLEEGASSYDMKEGMARSAKKKPKKGGGWYITVPFRHATSEAVAESMTFAGKMPSEIQKLVQTAGRPLNLADLPADYRERKTSWAGYKHKAAIYEGLHRRDISATDKEKRGGYYTFRRISDKSEENSWMHPGFKPLKLMEMTIQELPLDRIVDESIDKFLQTT